MSAADSSAIRYVACLCHRPRAGRKCGCEKCVSIRRVCRLASDHVTLKRIQGKRVKTRHICAAATTSKQQENLYLERHHVAAD